MTKAKYDALPDDQKAAIDANTGRELSKSAEDAWNATADMTIKVLNASAFATPLLTCHRKRSRGFCQASRCPVAYVDRSLPMSMQPMCSRQCEANKTCDAGHKAHRGQADRPVRALSGRWG